MVLCLTGINVNQTIGAILEVSFPVLVVLNLCNIHLFCHFGTGAILPVKAANSAKL
jgi:hypothetical protein